MAQLPGLIGSLTLNDETRRTDSALRATQSSAEWKEAHRYRAKNANLITFRSSQETSITALTPRTRKNTPLCRTPLHGFANF